MYGLTPAMRMSFGLIGVGILRAGTRWRPSATTNPAAKGRVLRFPTCSTIHGFATVRSFLTPRTPGVRRIMLASVLASPMSRTVPLSVTMPLSTVAVTAAGLVSSRVRAIDLPDRCLVPFEVGDVALGEHLRLAAPRAGGEHDGGVAVIHGTALLFGELGHGESVPTPRGRSQCRRRRITASSSTPPPPRVPHL